MRLEFFQATFVITMARIVDRHVHQYLFKAVVINKWFVNKLTKLDNGSPVYHGPVLNSFWDLFLCDTFCLLTEALRLQPPVR